MVFPMKKETEREKFLQAVELMEFGIELMRQNITRRNPDMTEKEVFEELQRCCLRNDNPNIVVVPTE